MEAVAEKVKILVDKDALLAALQLVSGAVEKRQTLPILSHVLLSFRDHELSITATDLEVELNGKIELAEAVESRQFTVPARKLIDICRALPSGAAIHFVLEGHRLGIYSGTSRFSLSTLSADDFPKVGKSEIFFDFTIAQSVLKHLLEKTHFAMAQQDVRYYLNGILLDLNTEGLHAVATDGHRLALASYAGRFDFKESAQVIIPRKGILELLRLLEDKDEEVRIVVGSSHIHAVTHRYVFTSKLIEGKFPDFRRVIPKNNNKFITIDRNLLKESLSRAAILCNEKYHGIRLLIENDTICMLASNMEQEEAEEKINVNYQGDKLDIGFNVTYLLDALSSLPEGNIQLSFLDSNSSVLIERMDHKDRLYVVMPMRL